MKFLGITKHHTAYIYVCLFKRGDKKLIFVREFESSNRGITS